MGSSKIAENFINSSSKIVFGGFVIGLARVIELNTNINERKF